MREGQHHASSSDCNGREPLAKYNKEKGLLVTSAIGEKGALRI